MSFKRLQLKVAVSNFLALTPWSSDAKPIFNEKLYTSLVIISLTLFAVAGLVCRGFYLNHIHFKIIVNLLSDLSLLDTNWILIVNMVCNKKTKLTKLLNNLTSFKVFQWENAGLYKLPVVYLMLLL
jgi:hypothetical protein